MRGATLMHCTAMHPGLVHISFFLISLIKNSDERTRPGCMGISAMHKFWAMGPQLLIDRNSCIIAIPNRSLQVGQILDAIEGSGFSDDTFVMLSTDHGGRNYNHGRGQDSDLNIPMFLKGMILGDTQNLLPKTYLNSK